jgi:cyclopropane fatty-acyl-phospholipid synthase-like methyltransferase
MDQKTKEICEFYNDTAQDWADSWYENNSMMPILEFFMSLLPENPCVLDLGCGAGYESMRLASLGAKVSGVDISENSIQIARKKNPEIPFYIKDIRNVGSDLGKFDGIISIAALIHVTEDELNKVFTEAIEHLNKNGYFAVIFSDGKGYSERRSVSTINNKKYNRYFCMHDRDEMNRAAKSVGFEFIQEYLLPEDSAKSGWVCMIYRA